MGGTTNMPPVKRWSLSPVRCALFTAFSLYSLFTIHYPLSPTTAYASEFSILPSIGVSEEYNDNVLENNDKKSDFITRLMPGIAFGYSAPFWDWDLAYFYDYRYYALGSQKNDDTHNLTTNGVLRLINDFMFLGVNDTYSRVSLNIARDRTQESLFQDQSDSNTFTASPYFLFHPAPKVTIRTGYRYINVYFKDPAGIDRRDHVGFMEATYAFSPKLNLTADYIYTHENSVNPYNRHNPDIGFRYTFKERSFIFGQVGYTWFSSINGGVSNNPFWNAGLTYSFDHISITLATGVQYPIDPVSGVTKETDYSFAINKHLDRGAVGASIYYSNYGEINAGSNGNSSGTNADTSNKYGAGITANYELLSRLNGTLSGSIERYDQKSTNSYTRRILVNSALTYALPWDFAVALNYVFVDSYSPTVQTGTYQVNRVSLELRKSFGKLPEKASPAGGDLVPGTGDSGQGSGAR
jgi:predicted porin